MYSSCELNIVMLNLHYKLSHKIISTRLLYRLEMANKSIETWVRVVHTTLFRFSENSFL